jgi:hypothetical protein
MKPQDLYRDWRIMAGLALVLLGAGNWAVGLHKTQQAIQMIAQSHVRPGSDYRSFDEVDAAGPVLKPFTEEEARVSYATARMDFYHVIFLSGQAMVIAGLLVTLIGFINVIQRDTRRTLRHLSHEESRVRIRERSG